jgi:hypothetical protein
MSITQLKARNVAGVQMYVVCFEKIYLRRDADDYSSITIRPRKCFEKLDLSVASNSEASLML